MGEGQLSDVAEVSGLAGDTSDSTVTFRLYGPTDATCADAPAFIDTQPLIIGADPTAGTAQSAAFTPTDAGTYRWIATYDGNVDNAAVSGSCGDDGESAEVAQASPAITTVASAGSTVGGSLSDTATVTGVVNPVGPQTVTFELFGPGDAACVGPPVFTSTVGVVDGVATSAAYVPVDVGVHRWVATYNGDANNESVSGSCGDDGESAEVAQATPAITTVASAGVAVVGGQLSDTATVTGVVNPVGLQTVTFELFGPGDAACVGPPVFTSTVGVVDGVATSAAYVLVDVGVHRWVATYNGDANNASVSGSCGDVGESAEVAQSSPAITTVASAGVVVGGGQLSDTATVTGVVNPVGLQTVTFRLYGPGDGGCASAPVFTSTVSLSNGVAQSAAYTPTAAGTHRWVATYNGDANNASVSGSCGDVGESAEVAQSSPAITTVASAGVVVGGGQLSDTATVTGVVNPVGLQTVTFRLYGPGDGGCASAPVFTSTVVLVNGTAQSAAYTPVTPGIHRWIATYNGDVNNLPVSGQCGDPNETRTVDSPPAPLPPTGTGAVQLTAIALTALVAGANLLRAGRRRHI